MDYNELYNQALKKLDKQTRDYLGKSHTASIYNIATKIIPRDNPNIEAPTQYANENISEQDIINATNDFNNKNINWLSAALPEIYARSISNEWQPHAKYYEELGNNLKDFYQTGQPRSPTDIGKNFGGGYDFAQRIIDKFGPYGNDIVNEAGKGYQFADMTAKTLLNPKKISENLYKQREQDALMDYLENKAGVDAAYRDSIWQGIPFKMPYKRSPEEINNMALDYAEKSFQTKKGLLNKK